jgi:hypothetical protein
MVEISVLLCEAETALLLDEIPLEELALPEAET